MNTKNRKANRLIHLILAYVSLAWTGLAYQELRLLIDTRWAPYAAVCLILSLGVTVRFLKQADRLK
jgi:hypothetical protein